ncbi:hypothetical protein A4X06_0g9188 [Tilletia controversa]|uniref:Uncharacterized protein n=1 Tax=Tilletia controversa TaxID=13291 RepID=A0A8X7MIZ0_9BASI|nr:hypothetical protein A4X06_0g9188 [Tilletia controversa]
MPVTPAASPARRLLLPLNVSPSHSLQLTPGASAAKQDDAFSEDSPSARDVNPKEALGTSKGKTAAKPKTRTASGSKAQASKSATKEDNSDFQVSLTMTGTAQALKLPSSSQKQGRGRPKAKETDKLIIMLHLKDTVAFEGFKDEIVSAATEDGFNPPAYDKLDVKGKISAGGPWVNWLDIPDEKTFGSFTAKMRFKKREGFLKLNRSPAAASAIVEDTHSSEDVESEDEDIQIIGFSNRGKSSSSKGTKRKKTEDDVSDAGEEEPNTSKKTTKKVKVKDEAEEERTKIAADISRVHECTDGTCSSFTCWILRGGIHLPITNMLLDNWVAGIVHDSRNHSIHRIPNNITFERAADIAVKRARTRRRSSGSTRAGAKDDNELEDQLNDNVSEDELPSSAQLAFLRRPGASTSASGRSYSAPHASNGVRRANPEPGTSRRGAAPPPPPIPSSGPDITFTALASRIKLGERLVNKMVAEGVAKASSFARLNEEKLRAMGCLQGEIEEALDAHDRWRRMTDEGIRPEELVTSLVV